MTDDEWGNTYFVSYLDTANCFEKEVGSNINKYEVCDNIDLTTILQVEYYMRSYTYKH